MKFNKIFCLTFLLLNASFAESVHEITSIEENRDALSITIYNDNLALVNETRGLLLNKGLNRINFNDVSAQIRPETAQIIAVKGAPFQLIEQNFDYDLLSPRAMLNKAVGQEITVITTNSATGEETRETATVLANNEGPVLQYPDRIETGFSGRFAYKNIPDNLRVRPTLSILLYSGLQEKRTVQLTYLSSGFSWNADYIASLSANEQHADISGWITLANHSGTAFKNTNIKLVAGTVNQVHQRNRSAGFKGGEKLALSKVSKPAPIQEAFGDYHLYTLPFKTSILNQQTKQVALLSTHNVPVIKEYRLSPPHFNYQSRAGENIKANVYYHLENKAEHQLGLPLPKGVFRVYKNSSSGESLLIGEDRIQHTAINEKFVLATGEAFDLSMTRKQLDHKKFEKLISANRYENTFEVNFNNGKDEDVTISYYEYPGKIWEILESSHTFNKENAQTVHWLINVPAKGTTKLRFKIRVE